MDARVPQRRLLAPSRTARRLMALVLLLGQIAPAGSHSAPLSRTGRWSSSGDLGVIGTHVVLLREPQTNAAKLFLFGESGSNQSMAVWRFFAADTTPRVPDTLFVDSTSVLIPVEHPDTLVNDLFCNGHSILPDGRMLFVGGNYQLRNPCETVYMFDPAWLPGMGSPWTVAATMAAERWYATATALADGRILAAAGTARSWLGAFGGRTDRDSSDRLWHSIGFGGRYTWGDTTAVPANNNPLDATRVRHNDYTAGQFPPAREDHAFAGIPVGNGIVFGGRHFMAGGADTTLGDAWLVQPTRLWNDSVMTWIRLKQVDDDATPGAPEVIPCPRTRASLVWAGNSWGDEKTTLSVVGDSLKCFLFGGLDSTGHALSDLWVGRTWLAYYEPPVGMTQHWRWTKLLADDDPARARFGHTMWFDPGDGGDGAPYARLVVFGGQVDDTTLASDSVYTYGVGSSVSHAWKAYAPSPAPFWGSPQARQGHMATQRRPLKPGDVRKFYLYGGQDASGNLLPPESGHDETNDTHVWALTRSDATAESPNYAWDWIAWSSGATGGPASRARAGMTYDSISERLVVVGGDVNGDGNAGGLSDSVWCIQVEVYGAGVNGQWFAPLERDHGHPPMRPTKGLSLFAYGDAGYRSESSMEAYSPAGSSSACDTWPNPAGGWTTITTQDSLSQREISAYPFLFVLPDGRLFNAGPSPSDQLNAPYRRFYDLGTNRWADDDGNHIYDAKVMGSAVMYRPGKVLRAGSHGPGDNGASVGGAAHGRTETVEIGAGAMPAWVERVPDFDATWPLTSRLNHNLTVLPTGDVLATGGVTKSLLDGGVPISRPQLWRVAAEGWNNDDTTSTRWLAGDPGIRNYHSAAMLLPDGRVMTSGGEAPNDADKWKASFYEPPYLFSGDAYAVRPRVADAPELVRYGEPFTLTLADTTHLDSIRSLALVRPAAVTHGFDQNQRYVPLEFVPRHNPGRLLAWAPADSFVAPPGEYLLFVTRGRGNSADSLPVPSIAKWVVVGRPAGTQRDSLDVTAPRGGAYLQLARANPCANNLELDLIWDAPADDDTLAFSGKARSYNLRWVPNDNAPHFNLWSALATSPPQVVYSSESAEVTGIQAGVWYRFGLKAVGDNADSSSLSNERVAKHVPCEGGSSGGGGGSEEGARARPVSVRGFGQGTALAALPEENTLFAGVPIGAPGRDVLRLSRAPARVGSQRRAFVRQGSERGLLVARARLLAVDHPESTEVVATPSGELLVGRRVPADSVHGALGRDLAAAATGVAGEPVYADSGTVLAVTLGEGDGLPRRVLLDERGGGSVTGRIAVEAADEDGGWSLLATSYPRREWDTLVLPPTPASRLRLTLHGAYALRFVGELAGAAQAIAASATLNDATSAYSGGAFDAERSAVDSTLAMVAGDTLALLFADLAPSEAAARTWLLEVEGTPVASSQAQALARRPDAQAQFALPLAFALHPAAPNPTRGTVRLAFDLPQRANVRLEVFDAQGRRVRRIEGAYEPGRHAIEWDLRHTSGPRVSPGIYTYRLTAGRSRGQAKLVVLQ